MADPLAIWNIAVDLRDEVLAALLEVRAVPPTRVGIVPGGAIAWDDCCGGQLSVAMERIYPTATFPDEQNGAAHCGMDSTAVSFVVAVLRCAPVVGDDGEAPSVDAEEWAAQQTMIDAMALWKGVFCVIVGLGRDVAVGEAASVGPEGGCVGTELRLTVMLDDDCPCEPFAEETAGNVLPGVLIG